MISREFNVFSFSSCVFCKLVSLLYWPFSFLLCIFFFVLCSIVTFSISHILLQISRWNSSVGGVKMSVGGHPLAQYICILNSWGQHTNEQWNQRHLNFFFPFETKMLYLWDIKLHHYQRLQGSIWYIPVIIMDDLCLAERSKSNVTMLVFVNFLFVLLFYTAVSVSKKTFQYGLEVHFWAKYPLWKDRGKSGCWKVHFNALRFYNFPAAESSCMDYCNLYLTKRKVRFVNCNAGFWESLTEVTKQVKAISDVCRVISIHQGFHFITSKSDWISVAKFRNCR